MWTDFGISGGTQIGMENVLVIVQLENGYWGYGEAAPLPAFNGETQDGAYAAVHAAVTRLIGKNAASFEELSEQIKSDAENCGSARCALEMALFDVVARARRVAFWNHCLGPYAKSLRTDLTITTGSVEKARDDAARLAKRGFHQMKIKVGGTDLDFDCARIFAAHESAPEIPILLDGNAAFSSRSAMDLLERLKTRGVIPIVFEQPTAKNDLRGLQTVTDESGVLTLADESASSLEEVRALLDERIVGGINVKLMKYGLVEAARILKLCLERKVAIMIGGMVESTLAMSCSACIVRGLGGAASIPFVDLDTPYWEAPGGSPLTGGVTYHDNGTITFEQIENGHGVQLRY